MHHLVRPRFLDLFWDAAEFDVLAEFWLCLHERYREKSWPRYTPYHALEIRLQGFARGRADELEAELCRRVLTPAFPEPLVYRPDPDTLAFTSGFADFTEQPAPGLALPLLCGEPFDGLLAEIRFTAAGFRRGPRGKSKLEGTVVLVGELRGGRFFAKSAWKVGPTGWEDEPQWSIPWGNEPTLLGALSKFRATGTVPDDLAFKCFTVRWAHRLDQLGIALTHVPLDRPRLGGLLLRLLYFTIAFAATGHLAAILWVTGGWLHWLLELSPPIWFVFAALGFAALGIWTFIAVLAFCQFAATEFRLFFVGRSVFRRMYTRLYARHTRIVPLTPEEAAARLDNPWARKYTAELLALGCTHAGVYRNEPEESGRSVVSLFLAPDGATNVFLLLTLGGSAPGYEPAVPQMWPAVAILLAETYFADGARFSSGNSRADGFRRKRTGPQWQFRVFADAEDPAEFLARHTEAVRRFAAASGRTPLPHVSAEETVRRHEKIQEMSREVYKGAPYTWADHLHRYLRIVRREYRE
jgi:hypothetical protein